MIYLDNSATTQPKEEVFQSFEQVSKKLYANPASIHQFGIQADRLLQSARKQIASLVEAEESSVLFTSGGTEANNLALFGVARVRQEKGRHIITTAVEHDSVRLAAQQLEREGFEVDYLSVDERGLISLDELKQLLRPTTTLVSIMHVNNEMGAIQPIEEASRIIKKHSDAWFHVDAVQSYGKIPVTFKGNHVDFYTVSGHKIHGLKGTGALLMRRFYPLQPLVYGGGQEFGYRSGTVAVNNAASLAKAMRLVKESDRSATYESWKERIHQFAEQYDNMYIVSTEKGAPHIVTLAFEGVRGEVVINHLQRDHIYVSTSSACSSKKQATSHVIEALDIPAPFKEGVIRISFGLNNEASDIDALLESLKQFQQILNRGK